MHSISSKLGQQNANDWLQSTHPIQILLLKNCSLCEFATNQSTNHPTYSLHCSQFTVQNTNESPPSTNQWNRCPNQFVQLIRASPSTTKHHHYEPTPTNTKQLPSVVSLWSPLDWPAKTNQDQYCSYICFIVCQWLLLAIFMAINHPILLLGDPINWPAIWVNDWQPFLVTRHQWYNH